MVIWLPSTCAESKSHPMYDCRGTYDVCICCTFLVPLFPTPRSSIFCTCVFEIGPEAYCKGFRRHFRTELGITPTERRRPRELGSSLKPLIPKVCNSVHVGPVLNQECNPLSAEADPGELKKIVANPSAFPILLVTSGRRKILRNVLVLRTSA